MIRHLNFPEGILYFLLFLAAPVSIFGQTRWVTSGSPTDDDLHNGFFISESIGWIISHNTGLVLHTTDRGASWQVQARLGSGYLESIYFSNKEKGWICGNEGRVYRTNNGGKSWEDRSLSRKDLALYGIHFFNPDQGFLIGINSQSQLAIMVKTEDGGNSWKVLENHLPGKGYADAIEFLTSSRGFIGGIELILRTTDRGQTWQVSHTQAQAFIRDLFFVNRRIGWAVGHKGLVLRTINGGTSWEQIPSFTTNRLRSVAFIDRLHGYVVGDNNEESGALFETSDGGSSWRAIKDPERNLHRLFSSPSALWIVGNNGTILSTRRIRSQRSGVAPKTRQIKVATEPKP